MRGSFFHFLFCFFLNLMLLSFLFEDQYFHICVLFHCSFFFFFAFVICWIFSGCSHHSKPCLQNQYFNPRRPPQTPATDPPQPQWSRPEHLETALKVAINQTDEFTKFIFLLFFFGFVFNSKNISNALIMKKQYIYTYIYYYCSQRIPHPTKVLPGTVSKLMKTRGSSSCGTPNVATLLISGSCSLLVLVYCAAAVCHSLCEFVLKDEHVSFASFGFRRRVKTPLSLRCHAKFISVLPPFYFFVTGNQRDV